MGEVPLPLRMLYAMRAGRTLLRWLRSTQEMHVHVLGHVCGHVRRHGHVYGLNATAHAAPGPGASSDLWLVVTRTQAHVDSLRYAEGVARKFEERLSPLTLAAVVLGRLAGGRAPFREADVLEAKGAQVVPR